jgi:two-component system, OmpR family, response regulator ResD
MLTILIIEDDPDLAEIIEIFLKDHGHVTNKAYTRDEGSDYLRTVKYDCVVLDNFMAGMNATDFLNGVQMQVPAPAVILVTGDAHPDLIAANLGVKHFLPKPFDAPQLVAVVERACAERPR